MIDGFFWIGVFIISLIVLVKGSDYFTDSAEKLGLALGMPAFIVGVTIVSMGTSLPELASSLAAMFMGASEIVSGNVIGSNIANIFFVLGVSAIFAKELRISREIIRADLPLLMGSAVILAATCFDGIFTLFDALLCLMGLAVYLGYVKAERKKHLMEMIESKIEKPGVDIKSVLILLLSVVAIYFGAVYLVRSVVEVSMLLNIGSEIIAVSAVALGTSVPELAVTLTCIRKGQTEMAVGNVLGSNIFNAFGVMGIAGLLGTIAVTPALVSLALPMMLAATFLYFFITQDKEVTEWEGWILLILYIFFIGTLLGLGV